MPHQVHQRKFGRTADQRRAMLRNLSLSVLRYERVKTTEAKAKEVRRFVDRMINLGKDGSLEARRRATAWLPESVIVEKVFEDLANRFPDRTSGYVQTTRLARRVGDASPMMQLQLVPAGERPAAPAPAEAEEAKPRRRLGLPRRKKAEEAEPAAKATKTTARKKTTTRKKTAKS